MTKAQAKKYCKIKWDYARQTGCRNRVLVLWLKKNHPDVYELVDGCGYCNKYGFLGECEECPLYKLWGIDCNVETSPFWKWNMAKTPKARKKYAEIIYNDIVRS